MHIPTETTQYQLSPRCQSYQSGLLFGGGGEVGGWGFGEKIKPFRDENYKLSVTELEVLGVPSKFLQPSG